MGVKAADFETTTNPEDCRVWAWCICDIVDYDLKFTGNSIQSFMDFIQDGCHTYYFHNLKFDGQFIIDYLLRNEYEWTDARKMEQKQFKTLISDMGTWYSIQIRFPDSNGGMEQSVKIFDSLKILPMPIRDMPKTFNIEEQKLEIDYVKEREVGHELTEQERAYVEHDTIILAKALNFMKSNGQNKMTTASNALASFKGFYSTNQFKKDFPQLDEKTDADIRRSYKGGWTYLNPRYKNLDIGDGSVYDVNSMYPWAMKYCRLPYGDPVYFAGEYQPSEIYDLYVICIECEFKLKPGMYPSIQIKNNFRYLATEYLEQSDGPTILCLTSVDYELFLHNYEVNIIETYGGYMFMSKVGIFQEYIDYWYNVKDESRSTGNKGMEKISKLMLNSLYGKFGARLDGQSKIPYLDEETNKVRFKLSEVEQRKGGYIPIATFITSYCRDKIIRTAEVCGDRFIYADTDSVHIVGLAPVSGMDVDNHRLGAFKLEETFKRGRFIRQKTYMEVYQTDTGEKINFKAAGMPQRIKDRLKEDEFYEGASFEGKLVPRVVPGGVILRETTFQIKKAPGDDNLISS